jgi:hypothetical protein
MHVSVKSQTYSTRTPELPLEINACGGAIQASLCISRMVLVSGSDVKAGIAEIMSIQQRIITPEWFYWVKRQDSDNHLLSTLSTILTGRFPVAMRAHSQGGQNRWDVMAKLVLFEYLIQRRGVSSAQPNKRSQGKQSICLQLLI